MINFTTVVETERKELRKELKERERERERESKKHILIAFYTGFVITQALNLTFATTFVKDYKSVNAHQN